jgi:hypothetical protein
VAKPLMAGEGSGAEGGALPPGNAGWSGEGAAR